MFYSHACNLGLKINFFSYYFQPYKLKKFNKKAGARAKKFQIENKIPNISNDLNDPTKPFEDTKRSNNKVKRKKVILPTNSSKNFFCDAPSKNDV